MSYTRSNVLYIAILLVLFCISAIDKIQVDSDSVTVVTNATDVDPSSPQFAVAEPADY